VHATEHRHVVGAVDVTVISWLAVPSEENAVKLSVIDWPAPSCWIAVCVCRRCSSVAVGGQREGAVVVACPWCGLDREVRLALVTSAMVSTPLSFSGDGGDPAAPLSR